MSGPSPTPAQPAPSVPSTPPGSPPSRWDRIKQFVEQHGAKLGTIVTGGGLSQIDQRLIQVVPLPDELHLRGTVSVLISCLLTVVLSAVLASVITPLPSALRRRLLFLAISGAWLALAAIFYLLFPYIENAWKNPQANEAFYYWFAEPVTYGAFFGSIAAFLYSTGLVVYDLLFN